jgi:hypothetical protein
MSLPHLYPLSLFWTLQHESNDLCATTATKCRYSDREGVSDFSNGHLVTRVYSGSSVMSLNRPLLLWPSVATVLGDIISSPIAIVTIW